MKLIILWVKSNDKLKNYFSSSSSSLEKKKLTNKYTQQSTAHARMTFSIYYSISNREKQQLVEQRMPNELKMFNINLLDAK